MNDTATAPQNEPEITKKKVFGLSVVELGLAALVGIVSGFGAARVKAGLIFSKELKNRPAFKAIYDTLHTDLNQTDINFMKKVAGITDTVDDAEITKRYTTYIESKPAINKEAIQERNKEVRNIRTNFSTKKTAMLEQEGISNWGLTLGLAPRLATMHGSNSLQAIIAGVGSGIVIGAGFFSLETSVRARQQVNRIEGSLACNDNTNQNQR